MRHKFPKKELNPNYGGKINKGRISKKKNKKFEELYGIEKAKLIKKKITQKKLGFKHTEETKDKQRISAKKRFKENPVTKETRKKISEKKKGHITTEETKEKLRQANLGEKNHNWNNGSSFEPYSMNWTKILRRNIRERDNYTCQLCKKLQLDYAFDIHHVDYNKKNCNLDNLITLYRKCHMKTNFKRDYWINYFKNI